MTRKIDGRRARIGPRGTQPTYRGQPSNTSKLEKWLLAGRRCDADLAAKKWGMSRDQYNAAVRALRRRHDIDSDAKLVTRVLSGGTKRRVAIGSHTLIR